MEPISMLGCVEALQYLQRKLQAAPHSGARSKDGVSRCVGGVAEGTVRELPLDILGVARTRVAETLVVACLSC